jgi:cobalt-zinc-cadmium efflux system membrane fusion protein
MKSFIIYIALILLVSCKSDAPSEQLPLTQTPTDQITLSSEQLQSANIQTSMLEIGKVAGKTQLRGKVTVAPNASMTLCFPFGGYIRQINLKEGMSVHIGDVLATIENLDLVQLQQQFLSAKNDLNFFENDYNRQSVLNNEKANSEKIFQQAQRDLMSKKIEFQSLKTQLELAGINTSSINETNIKGTFNIVSKSNGQISAIFCKPGQYISPTEKIADIIDNQQIRIDLTATSNEISSLQIGQSVSTHVSNQENPLTAIIKQISPETNGENVYHVYCELTNPSYLPLPGTFVVADVASSIITGFIIPTDAHVSWQNQNYIFLADANNIFEMVAINEEYSEDSITVFTADPTLINRKYVSKNAYALLMSLKNKEE